MNAKLERPFRSVRHPSVAVSTLLLACIATLSGCRLVENMLTPKIPPGLNLDVGNEVWRHIPPINLSGTWIDSSGGRVSITEDGGYGSVTVQSEDTRFLWDAGEISILNGHVTLDRTLAGQRVDTLEGQMTCVASDGQVFVSFDFGAAGTWSREGSPIPLEGEWYVDGKRIRLTMSSDQSEFVLEADPALGWTVGRGAIRQNEATLSLGTPGSPGRRVVGQLRIGFAWTMEDIQRAQEQAQRAGSAGT